MVNLAEFRPKVEEELRDILTGASTPLFGLDKMWLYHMGFADQSGQPVSAAKGKYLRPSFCIAVGAGLGAAPDGLLPAAASLELIHRTTLIFDDIQDGGKERNGQPAVWTIWGANQAINAGLALSCFARLAVHRMRYWGYPRDVIIEVQAALEKAVLNLCRGQYLDLSFMEGRSPTFSQYLEMIAGKTGALFAAAAQVGALCANKPQEVVARAQEFGRTVGIAFQMHDDYLGIWGDEAQVGKTANDLMEKKKSLPVVIASERFPDKMTRWFELPVITSEEARSIKVWMQKRAINKVARDMVLEYTSRAEKMLEGLGLSETWAGELRNLLGFVTARSL